MLSLALVGVAVAVESGETLRMELVGGATVEGYFLRTDGRTVALSSDNRALTIDVALIDAVWRADDPIPVEQFRAELTAWTLDHAAPDHWTPSPVLAGAASVVWPGAGHALLGDWSTFAGYSAVECVLLGTAAYQIFYQKSYGPLVPLVALDLLFRGAATADAARTASRRRGTLVVAPSAEGFQLVWVLGGPAFRPRGSAALD